MMVGALQLSEILGVSKQQISTWIKRRETNNCPSDHGVGSVFRGKARGKKSGKLYDVDEWLEWRRTYVPKRGGRRPSTQTNRSRDERGRFLADG